MIKLWRVRRDLLGQRFGRMTVVAYMGAPGPGRNSAWLCLCDCAEERIVLAMCLMNGETKSCGCLNRELVTARCQTQSRTHGQTDSRTYNSWLCMKQRCTNPKATNWKHYGGNRVKVCERWLNSFEAFLADMGERKPGTTLGRFGDTGNYEPGNVAWMTRAEQEAHQKAKRAA
jgi:hypothetical protein